MSESPSHIPLNHLNETNDSDDFEFDDGSSEQLNLHELFAATPAGDSHAPGADDGLSTGRRAIRIMRQSLNAQTLTEEAQEAASPLLRKSGTNSVATSARVSPKPSSSFSFDELDDWSASQWVRIDDAVKGATEAVVDPAAPPHPHQDNNQMARTPKQQQDPSPSELPPLPPATLKRAKTPRINSTQKKLRTVGLKNTRRRHTIHAFPTLSSAPTNRRASLTIPSTSETDNSEHSNSNEEARSIRLRTKQFLPSDTDGMSSQEKRDWEFAWKTTPKIRRHRDFTGSSSGVRLKRGMMETSKDENVVEKVVHGDESGNDTNMATTGMDISDQELLAYVTSGAMDIGEEDLKSSPPIAVQNPSSSQKSDLFDDILPIATFTTASKKPINIPKKHLEFAQTILNDSNTKGTVSLSLVDLAAQARRPQSGFRVPMLSHGAGNRNQTIYATKIDAHTSEQMDLSESAISRSREENLNKLILDEYNKPYESRTVDKDDNESGNLDIENLMTEPTASFVGFMTASRKALPPVSTKGLKFANQLLNVGDEGISFGNGGGGGFMTASKKALPPVSLETMQKVDRLFADENIEQIEDSTGLDEVSVGRGFMTASRKKLPPVSKADLDSARRVLKVTEEITNNMANEFRGGGFMTASKKSLPPVSLENQASAAKLFENEAIDIVPKFGFATAFKKPMAPPSSSNIEFAKSLMSSAQSANIERQSSSEPGTSSINRKRLPSPSAEDVSKHGKTVEQEDEAPTTDLMQVFWGDLDKTRQDSVPPTPETSSNHKWPQFLASKNINTEVNPTPAPVPKASSYIETPKPTTKPFKLPLLRSTPASTTSTPRIGFKNNVVSLNGSNSLLRTAVKATPASVARRPFKTPSSKFIPPKQVLPAAETPKPLQMGVGEKVAKVIPEGPKRIPMREYFKGIPRQEKSVEELEQIMDYEVIHLNSITSRTYKFGSWGLEECRNELLERGCEPKAVTERWVENHYGWVVWKLAGLVRSFSNSYDTYWKKDVVVEQMMYRYQREYKDGKRSCFHLICEGDRTADSLIVLCIADVYVAGQSVLENGIDLRSIEESPVMVRVTDGWYSLKAHLDPTLSRAVLRGSLKIGQKIMIFGAQTVGEGQRPPLEIEDRLFMSLSSNGTRPAKWDAKLGYQARPYPFQVGIGSVVANGGPIPMMDIVVMRVYPICYVENKVMLSQAEEDEAERNYQIRYEKECQRLMFEYQKSSKGEGRSFEDYDIRGEVEERVPRRNVSRILKMLICDYPPDGHGVETTASTLLTIWNPDGGQTEVFKEGKRLKLFGLLPDGYKTDSGKAICPLKFGQKKIIIPMPVSAQQLEERTLYIPRMYMKIDQLNNLSQSDVFDVMGLVISSTESDVCIVDETLKSVKVQSYSKLFGKVKVGDVLCLRNVEYSHCVNSHFYSQMMKHAGLIYTHMGKLESELKAGLMKFRTSEDFQELIASS